MYELPEPDISTAAFSRDSSTQPYWNEKSLKAAHAAGRASRDGEVEALQARVLELTSVVEHGAIREQKLKKEFERVCLESEDTTALTYMQGYSEGKAWALEEAAKVCEAISDKYHSREGLKYPENKTDAETGASDCEAAIRKLQEGL